MIVPATMDHVRAVLSNLCAESAWDSPTEGDLKVAMARAHLVWAGVVDNEVLCVAGTQEHSLMNGGAYVWMLTANVSNKFALARGSREVIDRLLTVYPRLTGFVDARHERSIHWLRWLGFDLGAPLAVSGRWLRPFCKGRD